MQQYNLEKHTYISVSARFRLSINRQTSPEEISDFRAAVRQLSDVERHLKTLADRQKIGQNSLPAGNDDTLL